MLCEDLEGWDREGGSRGRGYGDICMSFILAILVGIKWYLIVSLICISLMANNIEYLFICLSSLEKCLFRSFAEYLNVLFVFLLLSCNSSLYILQSSPLSDI